MKNKLNLHSLKSLWHWHHILKPGWVLIGNMWNVILLKNPHQNSQSVYKNWSGFVLGPRGRHFKQIQSLLLVNCFTLRDHVKDRHPVLSEVVVTLHAKHIFEAIQMSWCFSWLRTSVTPPSIQFVSLPLDFFGLPHGWGSLAFNLWNAAKFEYLFCKYASWLGLLAYLTSLELQFL